MPQEVEGDPDARRVRVNLDNALLVMKGYRVTEHDEEAASLTEFARRFGFHTRVRSTEGRTGSWARRHDPACTVACDDTVCVLSAVPITDAMLDFAAGCTRADLRSM